MQIAAHRVNFQWLSETKTRGHNNINRSLAQLDLPIFATEWNQ